MPLIEATNDPTHEIPDGTFVNAKLTQIELADAYDNNGKILRWTYRIVDQQWMDQRVSENTGVNVSFDYDSKLRQRLAAFLGDDVNLMQQFDTDHILNAVVQFQVESRTGNNGRTYVNIQKNSPYSVVTPPPSLASAPQQAVAAPPVVQQAAPVVQQAAPPVAQPVVQQAAPVIQPVVQQAAAPLPVEDDSF